MKKRPAKGASGETGVYNKNTVPFFLPPYRSSICTSGPDDRDSAGKYAVLPWSEQIKTEAGRGCTLTRPYYRLPSKYASMMRKNRSI